MFYIFIPLIKTVFKETVLKKTYISLYTVRNSQFSWEDEVRQHAITTESTFPKFC